MDTAIATSGNYKLPASSRGFPGSCLREFRAWSRRAKGFAHGEQGQSSLEYAITLPILLAFLFGIMEVCMAFYIDQSISELAREGTRYAIVHGATCETSSGSSCTVTATQVNTYVAGLGLINSSGGAMTVATTYPDGNEALGSRVQVNVQYIFPFNVPFMAP